MNDSSGDRRGAGAKPVKRAGFHETLSRPEGQPLGSDRAFGVLFAVVFVLIASWPLMNGGQIRLWAIGIAVILLLVALIRPALLRPLNAAWMAFGRVLHHVMTPLILGFLFFAVISPIAWLMRCFGSRPLQLELDPSVDSYWIHRTPPGPAPDTMNRPF